MGLGSACHPTPTTLGPLWAPPRPTLPQVVPAHTSETLKKIYAAIAHTLPYNFILHFKFLFGLLDPLLGPSMQALTGSLLAGLLQGAGGVWEGVQGARGPPSKPTRGGEGS